MRIGELARRAGVSRDTLRYYEKAGLVRAAARTEGRYREYRDDAVARLAFIRKMQSLGFTLRGIRDLLILLDAKRAPTCGAVGPQIKGKMHELDRQIEALTRIRCELGSFFLECKDSGSRSVCAPLARIRPN